MDVKVRRKSNEELHVESAICKNNLNIMTMKAENGSDRNKAPITDVEAGH